jgi:hypothetical protein
MAKKVKDPKEEPKFRKLEKGGKTKAGEYYQIGDKHIVKADKVLKIESKLEVIEHDGVDSLPVEMKIKHEKNNLKIKNK